MITTDLVINELRPTRNKDSLEAIRIIGAIRKAEEQSKLLIFKMDEHLRINRNYEELRKRYYGWMTKSKYLRKLIQEGKLTEEVIKSENFKHHDEGECSLIAIAMTNVDKYTIISNDAGKQYCHPKINLYSTCKVKAIKYDEWKKHVSSN